MASADAEKVAASETDKPMQPSNLATGTTNIVVLKVVVSVLVLPLLPFMPGMYSSVVVIMVMWLVSVVVLLLLPFRLLLVLTKTVIMTVGLVVIKTLSPDSDGTMPISSLIKALISDKEICSRAALPLSACLSASPSPMDAGKMMT